MKAIIVIVGAIILLGALAYGIMPTIQDFQTENIDQNINVSTGVGVTTATMTLGSTVWNDSLAYLSISSNNSSDVPIATSYNVTSKSLTVSGLSDNTTRILTISYKTNGLDEYRGVEQATTALPTVLIVGIIAVVLGAVVIAFMRR
jgi:hypothetical protein